jgi:hypothetical protein
MSIRQYIQRQRNSIDRHVGQKRIDGGQCYGKRFRSNENFQGNPFTRRFFVVDGLALRNQLHNFFGHPVFPRKSTGRQIAQVELSHNGHFHVQRERYRNYCGSELTTPPCVASLIRNDDTPALTTTATLTERAPAHEVRSRSLPDRHRRGRHARRSHHAAEGMAAMSKEWIGYLIAEWAMPVLFLLAIVLGAVAWIKLVPL